MERKRILRSQQGFTLIEIISVLVLIGILAAVAVPKYFDLQTEAKNKAIEGAVAEGIAQVNLSAAKYLLEQSAVAGDVAALATVGLADISTGDFAIAFADTATAGEVSVTASGNNPPKFPATLTMTKTAYIPK